jgi:hypothetical protein
MPMIRSNKLVGAASLSLVLCLTLTRCVDNFMWPDDLPEEVTVRTSEWLGEYDGAATVLVYGTGSVYSDVSGYMSMVRVSVDSAEVSFSVGVSPRPDDLAEIGDFTGGPFGTAGVGWNLKTSLQSVMYSSVLTVTYQYGSRRHRLSLSRSGRRLTGLLYVDDQNADGTYEVVGEIQVDVTRQ